MVSQRKFEELNFSFNFFVPKWKFIFQARNKHKASDKNM